MSCPGTLTVWRSEGTLISALSARLRPNPVFASRLSRITVSESKGMVTDQRKWKTYAYEDEQAKKDHPLVRVHVESASFTAELALGSWYLMGLFSLICKANCSAEPASTLRNNSTGFPMTSPWCNLRGEIERHPVPSCPEPEMCSHKCVYIISERRVNKVDSSGFRGDRARITPYLCKSSIPSTRFSR
ncbi:hypothetical protein F2P79_023765 [Pimephales promelas]|nr:hypothetical protein F2P79_023765 [Pimephales promelas]